MGSREHKEWSLDVHPEGNWGLKWPLTSKQWYLQIKERIPAGLNEHARICFVAANYEEYCKQFRTAQPAPVGSRELGVEDVRRCLVWNGNEDINLELTAEFLNQALAAQPAPARELRAVALNRGDDIWIRGMVMSYSTDEIVVAPYAHRNGGGSVAVKQEDTLTATPDLQ
jgi:hypothetical protein